MGGFPAAYAQFVTPDEDEVTFYTKEWEGERYPVGRPKVSENVLRRMERPRSSRRSYQHGYHNQFTGDWKMIHQNEPIVGRALTVQYMPSSLGLEERLAENGYENGLSGPTSTWPIEILKLGDVYVADGYGKLDRGTLIGDSLGTAIYANSGNGAVFNGSLRDLQELEEIDGFNVFVKDWHPSFIQEMMLAATNEPIRVGEATVLPDDVILAKREGVTFIHAQFAVEVVRSRTDDAAQRVWPATAERREIHLQQIDSDGQVRSRRTSTTG